MSPDVSGTYVSGPYQEQTRGRVRCRDRGRVRIRDRVRFRGRVRRRDRFRDRFRVRIGHEIAVVCSNEKASSCVRPRKRVSEE